VNRADPWDIANKDQARASDPQASVWVSAHAGSGKTHVLVNRVIRLLLAGVPPERILCLTYTRAAAAEMSRRLFDVLSSWIPLDDEDLIDRIHGISGYARFGGELKAARRLFAQALETPGGLKIQTIHAFCERLLQRFPVEAGVVPGFAVMDEVEAREVLSNVRRDVLAEARSSEGEAAAALAKVVAFAGDQQIDVLIKELLSKRNELKRLLSDEGLRDGAMERLARYLGVPAEVSEESVWAFAADGMDRAAYEADVAALLESTGKTDPKTGALLEHALAAAEPGQVFATLKSVFLTQAGETRKRLCTAATARQYPDVDAHLAAECERIAALAGMERAVKVRDASAALFGFADQIVGCDEDEKRRLGRYDYDDLITRTLSMFLELEHAAWVLYKLDGGLDHILIDEAQDTSPEQWRIVQFLAEDFFSGEGQRPGVTRTVFAVGDRKQSIFSFQGADPDGFDAMRRHFKRKVEDARLTFSTVRPTVSFRSTEVILTAVDAVFATAAAADGVTEPGVPDSLHQAVRQGPGLVEIWEPEKPDDAENASPWQAGAARDSAAHPRLRLARRIAATIRSWVDSGETIAPGGRAIRPGDILILVRNRTTFMDALVRSLKQQGIEVAGADRLILTKHIGIEDLLALARFTLLPDDDLTLAGVLKSPLLARDDGAPIDDDDLFSLAFDRGHETLWERLHEAVARGAPYGTALERLKHWRGAADFMPPYEFFSQVLTADGGRQAIMDRLGSEAGEPLDAFLSLALEFAPGRAGSLQAFLAALEDSGAEIKRDMDQGANEVRVMTVHGAKGLEAPIVFLPDTCDPPTGARDPAILFASDPETEEDIPLWRLKTALETPGIAALREAQQQRDRQEYNRLLYVAMTRARDRLYVGGCQMNRELKEHCWYAFIDAALRPLAREVQGADGQTVWRIEASRDVPQDEKDDDLEAPILPVEPPDWALATPKPEPTAMRWLIASRIEQDSDGEPAGGERVASPLAGAAEHRFRRGRLIHSLLQALPDLPVSERAGAGRRYLDRAASELDPAARQALLGEALAIIAEPSLAALFAPGSLAEVPLAAVLGADAGAFGLTGQIDRLAVTDDEVLIADYKTNRPPPASPQDADPLYVRQLAAYRAALARLYPGRRVRCVLVWTDGPRVMEIPDRLLDSALRLDRARGAS
jgi:ATP-dependent helicase/nuclease subunit A